MLALTLNKIKVLLSIIFFGLFFSIQTGQAQELEVDSLLNEIKLAKQDSTKLNLYLELSEICDEGDILKYAKPALFIAEKILKNPNSQDKYFEVKILKKKALALNNLGFWWSSNGDIPKAIAYYNKSIEIKKKLNDQNGIADTYTNIAFIYNDEGNSKQALYYHNWSLKIYKELKNRKGEAVSLNNLGLIHIHKGELHIAESYFKNSLKIRQSIRDNEGVAESLNNLGTVYDNSGDIEKVIEYLHKSLTTYEAGNEKRGMAVVFNNLGHVYRNQGDIANALIYYKKSLAIRKSIGDKQGIAYALLSIGNLLQHFGDPKCKKDLIACKKEGVEIAISNYNLALSLLTELNEKRGIASAYASLGLAYSAKGDYPRALNYMEKCLIIRIEIEDKEGISTSLYERSFVEYKLNHLDKSLELAQKSLAIAREIAYPNNIKFASQILYEIYIKKNKMDQAYDMFDLYVHMRDSINNNQTKKLIKKQQFKYEWDKHEALTKAKQDKMNALAEKEKEKQKLTIALVSVGLIIVSGFFIALYKRFKIARKQKSIIELQKTEIDNAFKKLHHKNKEIIDSIKYASKIQNALITSPKYFEKHLSKC